ncbi:MAG: UvrD-helicase domain-containing protein, partial [Steroidobacteraceae bacterium]
MTAADVLAQQLDQRARREALDAGRSMLLQAPAGSGKTTVLTARFLALLATVEQPEQIIAITFTRKAAAEMRRRVLSALQAARDGTAVTGIASELLQAAHQRDAQRGWTLLQTPSRLRIETIDALNHWLATQLPVSARSGPSLEIAGAAAVLYRRAARRCLQGATEEPAVAAAVERLFDRLDNDWGKVEQLLADMLGQRSHWLPRVLRAPDGELVRRVEQSLQSVLRAELARLVAAIPEALLREAEQLLDYARRQRPGAGTATAHSPVQLSAQPESLPHWHALCALTLTGEQEWRRSFTIREGFPPTDRPMKDRVQLWLQQLAAVPGSQPLCRGLRDLPAGRLEPADREALEALALLLTRAAAELQLVFASGSGVDYPYVAGAARAALSEQGAPTEFALRAGGALRHILVDEFQDTSVEQIELLQALTAGWAAGDGRTLFVVGDPMQSIYQFREAEVGLFLQARDRGIGEIRFESLELRHNFRSTPPLIRWVNENFARLFPTHNDARLAAISYLPSLSPPRAADDGQGGVRLHRLPPDNLLAEADQVVQIVRAARAAEPQDSIAILVASREHAQLPAARLRAAGFTLRGVDLERLRDRPVVRDLSALTRALLHAADRTAWLALLRAPWCALTLAEMDAVLNDAGADLFDALKRVADGLPSLPPQRRIARLCAALAPAIDGPERGLPLWQRVEHCWLRLAGPAVHRSEVDRIDAQRFLDALALHAEPDRLAGAGIGELTDCLWSAAPAQAGAIELMTMHAAKGLEWDVVILPGLHRRMQTGPDPLLHWIDLPRTGQGTDLLLAPIRASAEEARGASLANYIKVLRRERARLERVRLLYVAATSA